MTTIGLTQVGDSLATIIAAEALGYLKANTVFARLVARDWDSAVAQRGQTVRIPFGGGLTANAKAAATAVTRQQPNDTFVDVTLNQHYEVTFQIEDIARALATPDYLKRYMEDGVKVLGERVDTSLGLLYSGFSQTIDATGANGPLDRTDFRESRRLLNSARAPMEGRCAVLHEDAEFAFFNITEALNRDYAESLGAARADGAVSRFMGFDVFLNQNVRVVTAVCRNMFFHRNAMVLVTRPLPQAPDGMGVVQRTMEEDGFGIRVTLGYDKDLLGIQCTLDVLYGVAELRDNHGVVVTTTEI